MTSSFQTERPWGIFETLYDTDTYKVKRIYVNPDQSFSLQYHLHRCEDWIIVEGSGKIRHGEWEDDCVVGDRFHIPANFVHRATAGPDGLTFIEVQRGVGIQPICDEDDIVRLEDNYGRVV